MARSILCQCFWAATASRNQIGVPCSGGSRGVQTAPQQPHTSMREIINTYQAEILSVLVETVDANRQDIIGKTGMSYGAYQPAISDLRERDLVRGTKSGSKHVVRLSITTSGARALTDYIERKDRVEPQKALPPRRNLFAFPVWSPPKPGFVRNSGNAHINSHGVRC